MKKIAVVTGASSGMGREAAVQLADQFGWLDEIWLIARGAPFAFKKGASLSVQNL